MEIQFYKRDFIINKLREYNFEGIGCYPFLYGSLSNLNLSDIDLVIFVDSKIGNSISNLRKYFVSNFDSNPYDILSYKLFPLFLKDDFYKFGDINVKYISNKKNQIIKDNLYENNIYFILMDIFDWLPERYLNFLNLDFDKLTTTCHAYSLLHSLKKISRLIDKTYFSDQILIIEKMRKELSCNSLKNEIFLFNKKVKELTIYSFDLLNKYLLDSNYVIKEEKKFLDSNNFIFKLFDYYTNLRHIYSTKNISESFNYPYYLFNFQDLNQSLILNEKFKSLSIKRFKLLNLYLKWYLELGDNLSSCYRYSHLIKKT